MLLVGKSICTDWTINLTGKSKQLITDGCVWNGRRNRKPSKKKNTLHETNISGLHYLNSIVLKSCQII